MPALCDEDRARQALRSTPPWSVAAWRKVHSWHLQKCESTTVTKPNVVFGDMTVTTDRLSYSAFDDTHIVVSADSSGRPCVSSFIVAITHRGELPCKGCYGQADYWSCCASWHMDVMLHFDPPVRWRSWPLACVRACVRKMLLEKGIARKTPLS